MTSARKSTFICQVRGRPRIVLAFRRFEARRLGKRFRGADATASRGAAGARATVPGRVEHAGGGEGSGRAESSAGGRTSGGPRTRGVAAR